VSEAATLDKLKQMLKDEGAIDALNLDGGGSSALVARVPGPNGPLSASSTSRSTSASPAANGQS
jgi:hypothetical protein